MRKALDAVDDDACEDDDDNDGGFERVSGSAPVVETYFGSADGVIDTPDGVKRIIRYTGKAAPATTTTTTTTTTTSDTPQSRTP